MLAGVRDGADPWALAGLPLKLPRGRYALGKGPVAIAPDGRRVRVGPGQLPVHALQEARSASPPTCSSTASAACARRSRWRTRSAPGARPGQHARPRTWAREELSDIAREQAELFGGEFDEWVGDELLAQNFPAIHAVGRAAARAPRLLEINWGNPKHPRIAIVGKGVCFDTGGLDIKGAEGMRLMKKDMGGAAHAIALARLIMQRKLPVRLQMLVPAVENAISGNAFRPGDVVRTRHGPQRGDRQHRRRGPRGAVRRARLRGGAEAADRSSTSPRSPARRAWRSAPSCRCCSPTTRSSPRACIAAAEATDDPMWRLPLWRNYRRLFDSDVADFNNSGKRRLRRRHRGRAVPRLLRARRTSPWAHFDVYLVERRESARAPGGRRGAGVARGARGAGLKPA